MIPGLDCYREKGYSPDLYPRAEYWTGSVLNLPNHPSMTQRQVDMVIRAVKEVFGEMYG
jgi:dTDP-4-amino-4,6-dideoxygalactose transaminase